MCNKLFKCITLPLFLPVLIFLVARDICSTLYKNIKNFKKKLNERYNNKIYPIRDNFYQNSFIEKESYDPVYNIR